MRQTFMYVKGRIPRRSFSDFSRTTAQSRSIFDSHRISSSKFNIYFKSIINRIDLPSFWNTSSSNSYLGIKSNFANAVSTSNRCRDVSATCLTSFRSKSSKFSGTLIFVSFCFIFQTLWILLFESHVRTCEKGVKNLKNQLKLLVFFSEEDQLS